MSKAKIIAIAGITAALSVVFLMIGTFIEVLDLSCLFLSSVVMLIPLAKKSYASAFLSYAASAILSFLVTISTGKFYLSIVYAVFFGLHPIINYLQVDKKLNKYIMAIVKDIWFVGTCFLMYYVFNLFAEFPEFIEKYIYIIIPIGGTILFLLYDLCMFRFQKFANYFISRIKI